MTKEKMTDNGSARMLIVRHGPGRGQSSRSSFARSCLASLTGGPFSRPRPLDEFLEFVQAREPGLRRRIDVWETGTMRPNISNVKAVLFFLQDPLQERFPSCFAEAEELCNAVHAAGAVAINPPSALSNAIKSVQSKLWRRQGLPTPRVLAFSNKEELVDVSKGIQFPALIRSDWMHGWRPKIVNEYKSVLQLPAEELPKSGCIAELVDTRESFQNARPKSEFAKYFHKKRVWVVGNTVQASHLFFSSSPIVSSDRSTFAHFKSLNLLKRAFYNVKRRRHVELDYEYFRRGELQSELFIKAAAALNLGVVGIDYSMFADGRIILWEANPYFQLRQWPLELLPRQRRTAERHEACYEAMYRLAKDVLSEAHVVSPSVVELSEAAAHG